MASVRLIAIDIDGTLLNPEFQVSKANIDTLLAAHEKGVEIALVTGRRHSFALPIAATLGFPVTLISSNGAVTRRSTGELFHRDLLPRDTALALIAHMTDFRNNFVLTFDRERKGTLVCESADELNQSIKRWMEVNAEYIEFIRPVESSLTEDPIQSMFCGRVANMVRAFQHLTHNSALMELITVLKTQYDQRDLCILDVLNHGCSKGHALERWARNQGFHREEVMAIGDNFNDVEMLEFAGIPVIMGNACAELKRRDWMLTLDNANSGVAHAVRLVLGS
jgi:Cof subfamily protein (haloacid dehalogenase superfamily)